MKALFDTQTKKLTLLDFKEGAPRAPHFNAGTAAEPDWKAGDYCRELTDAELLIIKNREGRMTFCDGDNGLELVPVEATIPAEVTARQFRLALNEKGDRSAVENLVGGASQEVQDEWEYGTSIERGSVTLEIMRQGLAASDAKWTEAYVDELFTLAATK